MAQVLPGDGKGIPGPSERRSSKRRRRPGPVLRACVPCRLQKLRCNKDELPCIHCQRRKVECHYEREEPDWQEEEGRTTSSSSSAVVSPGHRASKAIVQREQQRKAMAGLPHPPSFSQSTRHWFDHLLSFFGPNRQSSQRMVTFLLNNAFTQSHYYWFDMWHLPTIRRAGYSDRERQRVHPSLVFGMVAVGLRQRQSLRRPYGMGIGETMIPDEAIPPASGPDDVSEMLKEAGNTFLEQDLATPDRDLRSWLDTAKAALMLMQLENELSPRYLHLLSIARTVLRSSNLRQAIQAEAQITTGNRFQQSPIQKTNAADKPRSSIEMEEAARLALLPLWLGTRTGVAYFNVEIHQNNFVTEDVSEAYVFAQWPDGQPEQSQKKNLDVATHGMAEREEMSNNIRSRILGLNVMYTNYLARALPFGLDYGNPTADLNRTIRNLDDMEFMFEMLTEVVDWQEASYFRLMMIRFCTSVCYLHGVLIRRTGLAHSDALRQAVIARMVSKTTGEGTQPTANLSFQSCVLRGWSRVQEIYMTEMDLDFSSARGQGHLLKMTKFQSDVIRLYWLGTLHFYRGVKKTLRVLGLDPRRDPTAQMLHKTAQDLDRRIRRHDEATGGSGSGSSSSGASHSDATRPTAFVTDSSGHESSTDSQQ